MAGEESLVLTAPDDLSDQAVLESLQNLPDLTPSSLDFPQDQESICQNFALAVPQRDGDGSPSVGTAIADWCSQMDGVAIKKQPDGVDAVFQMWPFSYYSFWLSTRYWYQDDPYKCADQVTIYEDGCVNSLTKAMIDCDPDSGGTHGAAYPYDCIYYVSTVSNMLSGLLLTYCTRISLSITASTNTVLLGIRFPRRLRVAPVIPTRAAESSAHFGMEFILSFARRSKRRVMAWW